MKKDENRRISTGVPGLDEILDGGLLPRQAYLVRGDTAIADGIIVYDTTGAVIRMNPTAKALLGVRNGNATSPLAERIVFPLSTNPEGPAMPVEVLPVWQALRGETVHGLTGLLRPPDGREIWLSICQPALKIDPPSASNFDPPGG